MCSTSCYKEHVNFENSLYFEKKNTCFPKFFVGIGFLLGFKKCT
jgi:hypothetical protein